ncbi:MAG: hypothetical protein ACI4GW_03710 [Lachnospiraceae bacterium]
MAYEVHCKYCGKRLLKYEIWEKKYKSPIATCKKCGKDYIDPRCHEIAFEGIPKAELKVTKDFVLLFIGALIIWRGYYLFGMHMLGTPDGMQWLLPSVVLLLGIVIVIASVVDAVAILTGVKKRKFEKLLEESHTRIKDESYLQKLEELGYRR